jgi:hypothetical protein
MFLARQLSNAMLHGITRFEPPWQGPDVMLLLVWCFGSRVMRAWVHLVPRHFRLKGCVLPRRLHLVLTAVTAIYAVPTGIYTVACYQHIKPHSIRELQGVRGTCVDSTVMIKGRVGTIPV